MTDSRVKGSFVTVLLVLSVVIPQRFSWAQQTGSQIPTQTLLKPLQVPAPEPLAAPSKPRMLRAPEKTVSQPITITPASRRAGEGGIQVNNLSPANINEIGVLVPSTGALGIDMWKGTSSTMVARLLPDLPTHAPSSTMRDLMRRLLMSPARVPSGGASSSDKVGNEIPSLITKRIELLMTIGDLKGASDLLQALPAIEREPELVRLDADLSLLSYDLKRVCSLAVLEFPVRPTPYWQKVFNFCQIIDGRSEMAELGLSMMQEMGDEDELYFQLAESLISKEPLTLSSMANPTPLQLAMARVANLELPADILGSNNPSIARAVAVSSFASKGLRLEAAERADAAGALPKATLRQLYASVEFTEADRANPLSRAEVEFGPMVRALLYHSALTQTVPTAKAEATSRAFQLARDEGRYASTVQVFEPVLHRIPPSADLKWFAPEAVRAFLIIGDQPRAEKWYQIIQSSAGLDEGARKELAKFRPVAWLFKFPGHEIAQPGMIDAWSKVHRDDPEISEKSALLFNVLEALGLDVPVEAWDEYVSGSARQGVTLPSSGLWRRLQALANREIDSDDQKSETDDKTIISELSSGASSTIAKQSKLVNSSAVITASLDDPRQSYTRVGETVLLSLMALGNIGPEKVPPFVLRTVLNALDNAGLNKEARALALDAILARGL